MYGRRELPLFALTIAMLVVAFFHDAIIGGKVLSSADVLFVTASFREVKGAEYEPMNRLLIDPVLQFQPWLEFNRAELRAGRLPLWNPYVGCGAPHLANGQSAVFDPFHLIAYLGTLPWAIAPMAAARLWVAGLGMFLLARRWGLGRWGRWFAGLVYPFSGFLVVWLLYPVTNVAVWFPWVLWASDRVLDRATPSRVAAMALTVGVCLLGGHVQTSAHVLLAAGLNLLWRWRSTSRWGLLAWGAGVLLGVGIAAIEIVPLADYLTKSPVWTDRAAERRPPWTIVRPRVLDAACTALPYAFGSQRRGHPNLARGLGVHNVNESAGGFAGLATLVWLAPMAWSSRKPRVRWLFGLTGFAMLAAFRWPPADNLLRAIPVLNVTDNRRLTLWVALGLSLLGGVGLDRIGAVRRGRGWGRWGRVGIGLAGVCAVVAVGIGRFEPAIRARAVAHYERAARETPGAEPGTYRARADRQVRDTLAFIPRYYGLAALHLAGLSAWFALIRSRRLRNGAVARGGLLLVTLVDLFGFGLGLNPAIDPADDRPVTPLIAHLRRVAPPPARVLGIGEELAPNVCMRYGLSDIRNYDSVELAASVDYFAPLYPPGPGERTSRRTVTWEGAIRARDRLRRAGVAAIVGATPPPPGAFDRVDRVGSVWVARVDPVPVAFEATSGEIRRLIDYRASPREINFYLDILLKNPRPRLIETRETWDDGWSSTITARPGRPPFALGYADPGRDQVVMEYDPACVRVAGEVSLFCLAGVVLTLTRFGVFPSTRIVLSGLGSNPTPGLESDTTDPLPDLPTGENARTRR